MTTPRGAPELVAAQALPETTVNEQARQVGAGAEHYPIVDKDLTAAPGTCADGARYIVGGTPGGGDPWFGKGNQIAIAVGVNAASGWLFAVPVEGTTAYAQDENARYLYGGASWALDTAGGGAADFTDLGDVPASYSGESLKAVRVNAGETGLEFYTPSGGGGAWELMFRPYDNEPPTTNYATLDTRNSHPCLDFDTTTQETAIFSGVLPASYAGGGITVYVHWAASSATTGTIGWDVSIERVGTALDIDADSFATAQTITAATVSGTSGILSITSVAIANGADMDSLAAGESFRIRVRRDVTNDTATGDAELFKVVIKET